MRAQVISDRVSVCETASGRLVVTLQERENIRRAGTEDRQPGRERSWELTAEETKRLREFLGASALALK
jgi:hypothetical protein